jgi:hypothetical protein
MIRARAKAIEDKVNSLLSELLLSTHETWLLSQTETLCLIRYLDEGHGAAASNGQDGEDTKEEGQEEEPPKKHQPPDDRSGPDVRRLKPQPAQGPANVYYSERTSGPHRTTGQPTPEPNQRKSEKDQTSGDRTTGRLRTSGVSAPEPK